MNRSLICASLLFSLTLSACDLPGAPWTKRYVREEGTRAQSAQDLSCSDAETHRVVLDLVKNYAEAQTPAKFLIYEQTRVKGRLTLEGAVAKSEETSRSDNRLDCFATLSYMLPGQDRQLAAVDLDYALIASKVALKSAPRALKPGEESPDNFLDHYLEIGQIDITDLLKADVKVALSTQARMAKEMSLVFPGLTKADDYFKQLKAKGWNSYGPGQCESAQGHPEAVTCIKPLNNRAHPNTILTVKTYHNDNGLTTERKDSLLPRVDYAISQAIMHVAAASH